MEHDLANISYFSSSDDEDFYDSFDYSSEASIDSEDDERQPRALTASDCGLRNESNAQPINITQKIINRERNVFSGKSQQSCAFIKVPNRLSFCLKDIVPRCFLQGHMFMGLSFCGQFLLSYKVSCNDSVTTNHYSFNIGYVYTLYFWEYQPHKPLRNFYKCCLFDDHGVDNLKRVTMTQWKCADPRILIVHGAAEDENEDSYITYVKVPKLGCLDCKKLREEEDGAFRSLNFCLKCNLTIHTKYSSTESDQKFNPYINLICPDRILIVSNGFMHMLRIDIQIPNPLPTINYFNSNSNNNNNNNGNTCILSLAVLCPPPTKNTPPHELERRVVHQNAPTEEVMIGCDNHNNIVARIIADFSDFESTSSDNNQPNNSNNNNYNNNSSSCSSSNKNIDTHRFVAQQNTEGNIKTYDELIFTCNGSNPNNNLGTSISMTSAATNSSNNNVAKTSLISHRGQRRHRIVTKSYRNGVNTVDVQTTSLMSSSSADGSGATSSSFTDKSNTYEFSEDNEKCEKISTLRKRRLADKKYEFSEDNSENIVPFTKLRSTGARAVNTLPMIAALFNTVPTGGGFTNSPCASPSSSPLPSVSPACSTRHCTPPPFSALQLGFCSPPCNSPVASSVMRSPSRQIYNIQSSPSHSAASGSPIPKAPLSALSALQVSMAKRNHMEINGSMSPNGNILFLSPRREENRVVEVPLQDGIMPEKPICTKKLKRRYVENDDAASVITSEEDDCISPGYHTSLPMEVHGSCYSELQMISKSSYQQLRCTSVVITQHSFDLETFTYYVISTLCQKNNKTYDVFYDWACELISVCPISHTIMCLLMAQFSARDQLPISPTNCLNCSRKLSCAFHRKQFECRILFIWNMETGEWEVLDYGEMHDCTFPDLISPLKRCAGRAPISLADRAKKLASELAGTLNKVQDYSRNLRVLDSSLKKSKTILSDLDNMIEFHKKRHHAID